MALPSDFNKIFGSTATGGLTPISDVNYAKGWEYLGANPPEKNDFSYVQNLSDLKAQYLYKAIGGDSGAPAIGIPFFWPSSAMPNSVISEWSGMVFLKFNNSTFSASTYPKLALVFPSLRLPDARGEFIRVWDDGRGVDSGRALLSAQADALQNITGTIGRLQLFQNSVQNGALFTVGSTILTKGLTASTDATGYGSTSFDFDASRVARTAEETRPRNISFNLIVRAK